MTKDEMNDGSKLLMLATFPVPKKAEEEKQRGDGEGRSSTEGNSYTDVLNLQDVMQIM